MPGIIDSSPVCVVSNEAAEPADDSADFILQANYEECAGFGTFMPGSTYGEEGSGAEAAYMILTWLGIAVTLAVLLAWVLYENRQLIGHVARLGPRRRDLAAGGGPPPQPDAPKE
jgi:hypothetical protein